MRRSSIFLTLAALVLLLGTSSLGEAATGARHPGEGSAGVPFQVAQGEPVIPNLGDEDDEEIDSAEEADSLDVSIPQQAVPKATKAAPDTLFPLGSVPGSTVPAAGAHGAPKGTGPVPYGPSPPSTPSKPKTGFFGIHPAAILLGLAVVHYAFIRLVQD